MWSYTVNRCGKNENSESETLGQKSWNPAVTGQSVMLCARLFACMSVGGCLSACTLHYNPIPSACLSHLSTAGEQTSGERERKERGGQRKFDRERNGERVTAGTRVI